MVVIPKKFGAVHICMDFRPLNDNVLREVHSLQLDENLAQLAGALVISKLDASCGFWQIRLSEQSQMLAASSPHSGSLSSTNIYLVSAVHPSTFSAGCSRSSTNKKSPSVTLMTCSSLVVTSRSMMTGSTALSSGYKRLDSP